MLLGNYFHLSIKTPTPLTPLYKDYGTSIILRLDLDSGTRVRQDRCRDRTIGTRKTSKNPFYEI